MPFLQIPPPCEFSVREDPYTVSKRWQEWAANLLRFIAASGITEESQKKEILLYTAGKEINHLAKEIGKATATVNDLVEHLSEHFKGRGRHQVLSYSPGIMFAAVSNWTLGTADFPRQPLHASLVCRRVTCRRGMPTRRV